MNETQNKTIPLSSKAGESKPVIKPDLMVHAKGNSGQGPKFVGTVDHLDGDRYIKLKKTDSSDGRHHWIPISWVEKADNKAVYLNKTEDEFRAEMFDSFPGVNEGEQQEAV